MQDGAPITEGYHTGFEGEYSHKILEGIVAFANSDGGTLYIGVDDDGTVVGVEDLDEASRAAATGISDNIRPDIMPFVSVEGTRIDDRDVVEIRVHEGMNKPYFLKSKGPREGGVFIRRGPASISASAPYIYRMIRDEPNETYESSLSIRQNLTFEETARIFSERGIGFGQLQMSSMGLMDGQMYTNLALSSRTSSIRTSGWLSTRMTTRTRSWTVWNPPVRSSASSRMRTGSSTDTTGGAPASSASTGRTGATTRRRW